MWSDPRARAVVDCRETDQREVREEIVMGNSCAGIWTVSPAGVMALSESIFEPLLAGSQKASLASLSL